MIYGCHLIACSQTQNICQMNSMDSKEHSGSDIFYTQEGV